MKENKIKHLTPKHIKILYSISILLTLIYINDWYTNYHFSLDGLILELEPASFIDISRWVLGFAGYGIGWMIFGQIAGSELNDFLSFVIMVVFFNTFIAAYGFLCALFGPFILMIGYDILRRL